MQGELRCTINGVVHAIDSFSNEPLLFFLRDQIGLRSTRYGCGQGTCGSCTVIIDGEAKMSCETITKDVSGKTIETAEIFENESIDYTKSVTGVAYSKDDAKITLTRVEDKPGVAANIFEPLSKNQINVDMVIQNISSDQKTTDITFTIKRDDLMKTIEILKSNKDIQYKSMSQNDKVSKISIVGAGMVSTPGVTYKMFRSFIARMIIYNE